MTDQKNAVVPFGKYKGQEIAQVMLRDPAYLQWLMQQAWFSEKFAPIYQLVVNNFAPPSEETPAHNAIQVRFLDFEFQLAFWFASGADAEIPWDQMKERFLKQTENLRKAPKPCTGRQLDWSLRRHQETVRGRWATWRHRNIIRDGRRFSPASFEDDSDVGFVIRAWTGFGLEKYRTFNIEEKYRVFVEIKPSMGDDYPAVLRQIKRQQQQAPPDSESWLCKDKWFLLVDQFSSQAVTLDQTRAIFERDNIRVVMLEDVRNELILLARRRENDR